MQAEELLERGDLEGALSALQNAVRADAANPMLRIFLFQVLCITGEWKRAITQLKLCAELDPLAVPMAQTYRECIACEVYREKVFSGEKEPLVFGAPSEWMALMLEALKALAAGQADQAAALRDRAFAEAPGVSGTLDGTPFDWIADADMRLGPLLEVIVNGRYFWMPFEAIAALIFEDPADLRDLAWMPGHLTLVNGGELVALVPTRYSGTTVRGSPKEKLARATSWTDAGAGTYLGLGQRLLATDQGDTALMDVRRLVLEPRRG